MIHPVWNLELFLFHLEWNLNNFCSTRVRGPVQATRGGVKERDGWPLHVQPHTDVSATRLHGGLDTTSQLTSKYNWKYHFSMKKLQFSLRLHEGRLTFRRSLRLSALKICGFLTFLCLRGPFLSSRIRIQSTILNADPDLQHWCTNRKLLSSAFSYTHNHSDLHTPTCLSIYTFHQLRHTRTHTHIGVFWSTTGLSTSRGKTGEGEGAFLIGWHPAWT